MTGARGLGAALLALALAIPVGHAQEIQESDLYLSDPANLARLVEEAATALRAGRPDATRGKVDAVLFAAGENPAPELAQLLARAHLLRAELALSSGDRPGATADIEFALAQQPAALLDPGAPRSAERLFRQIRSGIIGTLSVDSEPPGATVSIDGRTLGMTPLAPAPLTKGLKFVQIARPGFAAALLEARIDPKRPVKLDVVLERKSATFLLVTNAEQARVRIDGVLVGHAVTPDPQATDELLATFNLPIDPYDPSPLLLLRDVAPGPHVLEVDAPCYTPIRRTIEIPAATDSTTMLPLAPETGELAITGPLDVEVRVDGGTPSRPPVLLPDLCPGTHLIEVARDRGAVTRASVIVTSGVRTSWFVRFRPVLAIIGDPADLGAPLIGLDRFNTVLADGPATPDPASLHGGAGDLDRPRLEHFIAAWDADLVGWLGTGPDGARALWLVAAEASKAEILPLAGGSTALAAMLDAAPLLLQRRAGITLVEVGPFAHPLVAAIDPEIAHPGDGVRVGDEVITVAGKPLTSARLLAALLEASAPDAIVPATVQRPAGRVEVALRTSLELGDLDFRARGASLSATIAQLAFAGDDSGPSGSRALRQIAVGKALLDLGDYRRAYAALASAELTGLGRGTTGRALYYRGRAAYASGDSAAARAALGAALAYPEARLLGPDGPPVAGLAGPLLHDLGEPPAD